MSRLSADSVTVSFGSLTVLDGVSVSIGAGDRVGVVAPNGVGKSTLLRVLAGDLEPDSGSVRRSPASTTVLRLAQEPDIRAGESLAGHLERRTEVAAAQASLDASLAGLTAGQPGADDAYDTALQRWLSLGGADLPERMAQVTAELGLGDTLQSGNAAHLSGGEKARLGLAAVLLAQPDILLLDEPTNDLDDAGLALLEARLRTTKAGVVLVSHDRALLAAVTTQILELDEFTRQGTIFAASAEGVGARAARTDKALARLEKDAPDEVRTPWQLRLSIGEARRAGDVAVALTGAVVQRGAVTLGPVSLTVGPADRIRVTGPNGSGKTTLADALLGRVTLTSGQRYAGPAVVFGELDQTRRLFASSEAVAGIIRSAARLASEEEARTLLAKFRLRGDVALRPACSLSPGERTRAGLALLQARGVNFLVLDEPTNHLDIEAIEQLEQALANYTRTLILVTHDRRLAEAVRTDQVIDVTALRAGNS